MSETESIEILSDAGEVLASSPVPADLLTEGSTGEIRDFKTSMKVERDGRAATFRGRDADGRTVWEGRVIESAEPHDPRTGLLHLDHVDLKRGRRVTLRLTALTAAGVEQ
jgi:hypothetical protein